MNKVGRRNGIMLHPALAITLGLIASPDLVTHHSTATAFAPARSFTGDAASLRSSSSSLISAATTPSSRSRVIHNSTLFSHISFGVDRQNEEIASFDPFGCSDTWDSSHVSPYVDCMPTSTRSTSLTNSKAAAPLLALTSVSIILPAEPSYAVALSTGDFNPDSFKPVCATSDTFYRFLQGSTLAVVGEDNYSEYGPLIAEGLLRIRLELCVVESYFNEAVGPFIKKNGLGWILPWHETVETFIAGSIFALATTFILVSSTKIFQIIAFYTDLVVGGPCRLFGGFFFDRARGEPVTLDISFLWWKKRLIGPPVDFKEEELKKAAGETNPLDFDNVKPADMPLLIASGGVKVIGEGLKLFREFIEALDIFTGRYLVLLTSGYIIIKFVHFKVFPDFP